MPRTCAAWEQKSKKLPEITTINHKIMKLSVLLQDLIDYKLFGNDNVSVKSISDDSRRVKKGGLFVAIKGLTVDGHKFISQAIDKGVGVVVGEKQPEAVWLKKTTYVRVNDTRSALGVISSTWYGKPSEKLRLVGVTGTKGKTTTVHMIHHILKSLDIDAGLLSSITYPGLHVTTPGPIEINKILRKMVLLGKKHAVTEVSSHGIDQKRIAGIKFEVGVLTNISPEHLDYHKTFTRYKKTKMDFLKTVKKSVMCPLNTKLNIFPGKFNNLNAQAAIMAVKCLGIGRNKAVLALRSFKLPKGRLEEIKNDKGFRVIVDFAHTPDSLREVLSYLKSETKGKLIAVFGCAGERDRIKRSVMGGISVRIADVSVFTAEDPRSEDVKNIIDQMIMGARKSKAFGVDSEKYKDSKTKSVFYQRSNKRIYLAIPERGEAISFAINKVAKKDDIVVICGKGHEKSMAYNGVEYPWSDQEAVRVALRGGVKVIQR